MPALSVVDEAGNDDEINDDDGGGDRSAAPVRTRAALLRRQKLELRDMRRGTVSDMMAQRSKLSRRVDKQLQGRKDITRSMHSLVEETEQRHRQELADFECVPCFIRLSSSYRFIVSLLILFPIFRVISPQRQTVQRSRH